MDFSGVIGMLQSSIIINILGLVALGKMMKEIPKIQNWIIPFVLTIISLVAAFVQFGLTPDAFWNGVIAAGLAVFGNQLWKQAGNGLKLFKEKISAKKNAQTTTDAEQSSDTEKTEGIENNG